VPQLQLLLPPLLHQVVQEAHHRPQLLQLLLPLLDQEEEDQALQPQLQQAPVHLHQIKDNQTTKDVSLPESAEIFIHLCFIPCFRYYFLIKTINLIIFSFHKNKLIQFKLQHIKINQILS
jgi:hypothetical protein